MIFIFQVYTRHLIVCSITTFNSINIAINQFLEQINISQIVTSVCYIIVEVILMWHLFTDYFSDNIFCHFCASMISGLVTTVASMPVDIAKTRYIHK